MNRDDLHTLLAKHGFYNPDKKNTCYSNDKKAIPISKVLIDADFIPKYYKTIIKGQKKTIVRYFREDCPDFIQHEALNGKDKQWVQNERFDRYYQRNSIEFLQSIFPSISFFQINHNTIRCTDFNKTIDLYSKKYHELDTGLRGMYFDAKIVLSYYFQLTPVTQCR